MLSRRSLLGIAAAVSASGCYGQFALTRKLYTWTGSFGSKFVSTILMWVLIWWLYPIVGFIDLWVFNLIEFWTGANPMASIDHEDGSTTKFARLAPDTVRVTHVVEGREITFDVVIASDRAVAVRDVSGAVLASGERLSDGSIALANEGKLRIIAKADVDAAMEAPKPSAVAARVLAGETLASR